MNDTERGEKQEFFILCTRDDDREQRHALLALASVDEFALDVVVVQGGESGVRVGCSLTDTLDILLCHTEAFGQILNFIPYALTCSFYTCNGVQFFRGI